MSEIAEKLGKRLKEKKGYNPDSTIWENAIEEYKAMLREEEEGMAKGGTLTLVGKSGGGGESIKWPDFPRFENLAPVVFKPDTAQIAVTARKIVAILRENMRSSPKTGFRSGKLNRKKLWKAENNETRIFTRKQNKKAKSYNIALVVDESGSMGGPKAATAAATTKTLALLLSRIPQVSLSITGFSALIRRYLKNGEKLTAKKLLKIERAIQKNPQEDSSGSGWNCDGFVMREIARTMPQEGENIIIVLSDGNPCPHGKTEESRIDCERQVGHKVEHTERDLKEVVSKIEKTMPNTHIGSIGILTEDPAKFYSHNQTVKNLKELMPTTLNLLKSFL